MRTWKIGCTACSYHGYWASLPNLGNCRDRWYEAEQGGRYPMTTEEAWCNHCQQTTLVENLTKVSCSCEDALSTIANAREHAMGVRRFIVPLKQLSALGKSLAEVQAALRSLECAIAVRERSSPAKCLSCGCSDFVALCFSSAPAGSPHHMVSSITHPSCGGKFVVCESGVSIQYPEPDKTPEDIFDVDGRFLRSE